MSALDKPRPAREQAPDAQEATEHLGHELGDEPRGIERARANANSHHEIMRGVEGLGSSTGAPIDAGIRARFERATGTELGDVRVHSGPEAAAAASAVGARAFATGNDIVLGAGESTTDAELIAHEAAHTVQQAGAGTLQAKRTAPAEDSAELEADSVAAAVASGGQATVQHASTAGLVQRKPDPGAVTKATADALMVKHQAHELWETSRKGWRDAVDALDESAIVASSAALLTGWGDLESAVTRLAHEPVDPILLSTVIMAVAKTRDRLGALVGPRSYRGTQIAGDLHHGKEPSEFVPLEVVRTRRAVHAANEVLAICSGGEPDVQGLGRIATVTQQLDARQVRFVSEVVSAHGLRAASAVLSGQQRALDHRNDLLAMPGSSVELVNRVQDDAERIHNEVRKVEMTHDDTIMNILERYHTPEQRDVLLEALMQRCLIDSMIGRGGQARVLAWIAKSNRFKDHTYSKQEDRSVPTIGATVEEAGRRVPAAVAYEAAGVIHGAASLDPTGMTRGVANAVDKGGDQLLKLTGSDATEEEIAQMKGIGHVAGEVILLIGTMGYAAELQTAAVAQELTKTLLELQHAIRDGAKIVKLALSVGPDLVRLVDAAVKGDPDLARDAVSHGIDGMLAGLAGHLTSDELTASGRAEQDEQHARLMSKFGGTDLNRDERQAANVASAQQEWRGAASRNDVHGMREGLFSTAEAVERQGDARRGADDASTHAIASNARRGDSANATKDAPKLSGVAKTVTAAVATKIKEAVVAAMVAALQVLKSQLLARWDEVQAKRSPRQVVIEIFAQAGKACAGPINDIAKELATWGLMKLIKAALMSEGIDLDAVPGAENLIKPQVAQLGAAIADGADGLVHYRKFFEDGFEHMGEELGERITGEERLKDGATPDRKPHDNIDAAMNWINPGS